MNKKSNLMHYKFQYIECQIIQTIKINDEESTDLEPCYGFGIWPLKSLKTREEEKTDEV